MSRTDQDDAVVSLEDVFHPPEEMISLALSAEEWEVIIALAEVGGSSALKDLSARMEMEPMVFQRVISTLLDRAILAKGAAAVPADASAAADADVTQYLEYLRDLNYYQVLQLNPEADPADIRRAYFRLMREYHPDRFMREKNPETREKLKEIFRILTRAYETLSEPERRHEYDLTIPEFTGVEAKEDELLMEALWTDQAGPEALPESNPELAKSFYESALADFQRNDYASAELNFKLAVALDPKRDDYKAGLAKTRRILHKHTARDYAVKALYLEEEGKYRSAIRWMARAAELDPERPEYRYDLARLIEGYGTDLHAARMQILLALDRDPHNLDYLLLLAKIQERLGETTDARRTCRKILSLERNHTEAKKILDRLKR